MKAVRLAVTFSAARIHPMHAFVCESEAVDREVLLGGRVVDGTRTMLFFVAGDRAAYEAALADGPETVTHEVAAETPDGFYCYVRAPNRDATADLFRTLEGPTVLVVPPVEFRSDRAMHATLVGPSEAVQAAVTDLPDDLGVEVLSVGEYPGAPTAEVTDRQREAVAAAWDCGYYDVPRTGDIESVAAALDCAISTASTLLRRAERSLVADLLNERA